MSEPSVRGGSLGPAVCTIVAKNYLAYARTLMKSLGRRNPGLAAYVLFVDDIEGFVDPAAEAFRCLSLADLDLPRPAEFRFRYDVMELSTAVKPHLLRALFARGHGKVLYIDPDIWVFRPLDELFAALEESDVLLTPHLTGPLGDGKYPDEPDILLSGTYNLGFLGVADTPNVHRLLDWWAARCEFRCVSDITHGLFVDQRWMDLAPGFADHVRVLRDPGWNVAYWNLKHRTLAGPADAPTASGSPVRFYHWSGFNPTRPTALSKHQDRYLTIETEPLLSMAREYSAELLSAGYRTSTAWTYSLGFFKDGHPISTEMRDLFRQHPAGTFPDPFEPAGADSFVTWAVTAPAAGGPAPLLERVHQAWTRLDRSPRWKRTLPVRALRKVAVKLLEPVRAAFRRRAPLPPLAARVLERRVDLQQAFGQPGGSVQRLEFMRWLAQDGIHHHKLKPGWCAAWLEEAQSVGVMRPLLDLYDGDAALRERFPLAFVEEHDAAAFLAWLEAHAVERGLTTVLAAARQLFASRPSARVRAIYASRPDVQAAYPDALAWPPSQGFLGWLAHSGRSEHGLAEDVVLWFERSIEQHVCLQADAELRARPDWQALHPLGQTVFGRDRFLKSLQGEGGDRIAPVSLQHLCESTLVTPLEQLRLLHRHDADVQERFPRAFEDAEETDAFLAYVESAFALPAGWLDRARRDLPALRLREGATVVGYLRTESGMGELSRSTARALKAAGYPLTTVDVDDAPQRQFDLTLAHEDTGHALPFTVVHMNAPEALRHAERLRPWLEGRFPIGYWAWELPELPEDWAEAFSMFREVWTCSIHAATAIGRRSPVPVQAMWPALPDAVPSALTREDFGLPDGRFAFLFLYDFLSETERKNPAGLLDAFRQAFRADDRAHLVIKTSNGDMRRDDWKRLAAAAEGLPVTLFDRYLSRADVLALIRACDAYVSLHRAEGFGYTMAEAMAQGRPVVATHYSGNADFMTPWNSFPVPYRLVELDRAHGRYAAGQHWADPDLGAAAELMRTVARDRERVSEIAQRGQQDVTRQLSAAACGARVVARLRTLAVEHGTSPVRAPEAALASEPR